VLKEDGLISNYYGYSCQMSQSALQWTHFVRSCGPSLTLKTEDSHGNGTKLGKYLSTSENLQE
jgi:hypothetical protein